MHSNFSGLRNPQENWKNIKYNSILFINCMYGFVQQFTSMNPSTFNHLATILDQNKLVDPNYVDQKRNLDIVLTATGNRYVLTTNFLEAPGSDAPQQENVQYNKWLKDYEMGMCYLAFMSSVLQHQHDSFKTTLEIIYNLKEMFEDQDRPARQAGMKIVMSTKMAEGTPIQDHVLKMMDFLNKLEVLGVEIDTETHIDVILESLPDSFKNFKLNYNMNKTNLTMVELFSQLVAVEGIIKDQPSLHMTKK